MLNQRGDPMVTTPEQAIEYIKCSAIRYQLKCDVVNNDYRYVSGVSHAACIEAFSDLGYRAIDRVSESETQGFMTTADRFVTREEAYQIALQTGTLRYERASCRLDSYQVQYHQ